MQLQELLSVVQPFDVLLFHGTGLVSTLIRKIEEFTLEQGEFSHIGVIIDSEALPNIPQLKPGRKYILDSNLVIPYLTDGVPDVRTQTVRFGAQIRDVEDVFHAFYSKSDSNYISWCRTQGNPWVDNGKQKDIIENMDKFIAEYGYKPYELNIFELLGSVCGCSKIIRIEIEESIVSGYKVLNLLGFAEEKTIEDIQRMTVFCSEHTALVFQVIGKIPKSINPSEVAPIHFLFPKKDSFERFIDDPVRIAI